MSKKILSLALVVVMLMSMFAFSTSAADLSAGQIAFKVVSDAKVGDPAGTVVTVKVYYELPAGEEDLLLTNHNISLGYNNTAFSVETNAATADPATFAWGSTYNDYFKTQKSTSNAATTISNNIVKNFSDADTAQGWNAGVQIQELYEGSTYTTKTGFNVDPDCEIFSLQFVALKTIEATDTIGIVTGALGTSFFTPKMFTTTTTAGTKYDAANVILTESVAVPAAVSKYTVSFDANGGTGSMDSVTREAGEYTLPANGFTAAEGYHFAGWSVNGTEYAEGDKITVSADTTVKAVWAADPSITFVDTMARMEDWKKYDKATKFDAGIVCQLNNKALTFTNGKCNEIESIKFYLNDSDKAIGCYRIYGVDDTTYQFRLQITNVDKTSEAYATGDFNYRAVITFTDGTDAVEYSGTANFQTILTDGYAGYQAWLAQQ